MIKPMKETICLKKHFVVFITHSVLVFAVTQNSRYRIDRLKKMILYFLVWRSKCRKPKNTYRMRGTFAWHIRYPSKCVWVMFEKHNSENTLFELIFILFGFWFIVKNRIKIPIIGGGGELHFEVHFDDFYRSRAYITLYHLRPPTTQKHYDIPFMFTHERRYSRATEKVVESSPPDPRADHSDPIRLGGDLYTCE